MDERTVKVNGWSSAEWALALPGDGALGNYSVRAMLEAIVRSRRRRRSASGDGIGPRSRRRRVVL